jgi:hypothetical protein
LDRDLVEVGRSGQGDRWARLLAFVIEDDDLAITEVRHVDPSVVRDWRSQSVVHATAEGDDGCSFAVNDYDVAGEGHRNRWARNGGGNDGVSRRWRGQGYCGTRCSPRGLEEEGPCLVEHRRYPIDGGELNLVARCDHRVLHLCDVECAVLFAHPHQGATLDAFDPELTVGADYTLANGRTEILLLQGPAVEGVDERHGACLAVDGVEIA